MIYRQTLFIEIDQEHYINQQDIIYTSTIAFYPLHTLRVPLTQFGPHGTTPD